jgi:hypothetical protein
VALVAREAQGRHGEAQGGGRGHRGVIGILALEGAAKTVAGPKLEKIAGHDGGGTGNALGASGPGGEVQRDIAGQDQACIGEEARRGGDAQGARGR